METRLVRGFNHLKQELRWERWTRPVSIAPLITFRIFFGLLMFFSLLRFWWRGWVTTVYVQPRFHFTYWGFEWVQPLGNFGMHVLFVLLLLSALCITLGFCYRLACIVFFIGFTYVELIDVTTYLNHYYFISLVAFLLIGLPAGKNYSLDVAINPQKRKAEVPFWCVAILRFQVAIVYIFAGLAKLTPEWLFEAKPMSIWLPSKSNLPLVGPWMYESWVAYLFSWFGAAYDLFIVFFLLNKRTRWAAYGFVLVFHLATALFFPGIGMFPYVMIMSSLVFFSGSFHEKLLTTIFKWKKDSAFGVVAYRYHFPKAVAFFVMAYAVIQLLVPVRFLLYPGKLFWHEEGYRFSWRVMLMEKSGIAYFKVKSEDNVFEVNNAAYLTPLQEKMMSTQPDLILKYAHFLAKEFQYRGVQDPEVYSEVYVSLNGRHSSLFVDSTVNLAKQSLSWKHYSWVLPFKK